MNELGFSESLLSSVTLSFGFSALNLFLCSWRCPRGLIQIPGVLFKHECMRQILFWLKDFSRGGLDRPWILRVTWLWNDPLSELSWHPNTSYPTDSPQNVSLGLLRENTSCPNTKLLLVSILSFFSLHSCSGDSPLLLWLCSFSWIKMFFLQNWLVGIQGFGASATVSS